MSKDTPNRGSGEYSVKNENKHCRESHVLLTNRQEICLARDEFLINFKGDHILIYMYIFAIVLLLGTVLHCTT